METRSKDMSKGTIDLGEKISEIPAYSSTRPQLQPYETRRESNSFQHRSERGDTQHEEVQNVRSASQDILNNRQASPSRLAFITAQELPKFKGNRTSHDDVFTRGPDIEEFLNNFRAYLARHNIVTDKDKIIALKMNIHASQGDAKCTLSSILDDNINSEGITFEQVETLLKRVYKKEESTSFYKSAKHYLDLLNKTKSGNTVEKLRSLEIASKSIHKAFTERKAWENNNKSTQDTLLEFILVFSYSIYGGEKMTEKCLDKLESNVCPREINIKFLEKKRKLEKPAEIVAHVEERRIKPTNAGNYEKKTVSFQPNDRYSQRYRQQDRHRQQEMPHHRQQDESRRSRSSPDFNRRAQHSATQQRRPFFKDELMNGFRDNRNYSHDRVRRDFCSFCKRYNHNDFNCKFQKRPRAEFR